MAEMADMRLTANAQDVEKSACGKRNWMEEIGLPQRPNLRIEPHKVISMLYSKSEPTASAPCNLAPTWYSCYFPSPNSGEQREDCRDKKQVG